MEIPHIHNNLRNENFMRNVTNIRLPEAVTAQSPRALCGGLWQSVWEQLSLHIECLYPHTPRPATARLGMHPKDVSTPIRAHATDTGRRGSAMLGGGKRGQGEHPQLGVGGQCAQSRDSHGLSRCRQECA